MNRSNSETSPDLTSGLVLANGIHASDRLDRSFTIPSTSVINMVSVREHPQSRLSRDYEKSTLVNRQSLSFESKYKLCFTSDLSESSGEEQEAIVTHTRNGHQLRAEQKINDATHKDTDVQVESGGSYLFLEKGVKDFALTTDNLLFSEEFRCTENQTSSEMDSLSDTLTLKDDTSPRCSINSASPKKASSNGKEEYIQCHMDHTDSPLHSMTVHELRNLMKLLKAKMKGISHIHHNYGSNMLDCRL